MNNETNVPKQGALLLVSNHNNALIDALLIATTSGRFSYFLTRASVFKNPLADAFLRSLNMLPVYRMRDGWSTISNNNSIFNTCTDLLAQGETVALFPEGNHNIKRTVRNLSKGFTRIVFDTLEKFPQNNVEIVPIGLNFQQAHAFADSVAICYGKPIVKHEYTSGSINENTIKLKSLVSEAIKQLTTHIPAENYEETLERLEHLQTNFLNPKIVNRCIESNFEICDDSKTKDHLQGVRLWFKSLMILGVLPIWLLWRYVIKPKIKEIEFVATFRFAIVITLVPLWIVGLSLLLGSYLDWLFALSYLVNVLTFSLLAVKL